MNKGRRQELKQLKYIQRIKKFVANCNIYVNRNGEYICNPKTIDVIKDNGQLLYKTTGTPCSCWMCSGYYKHKRHVQKIIDRDLVNEGLDEYYNPE